MSLARLKTSSPIVPVVVVAGVYFAVAKLGLRLAFVSPSATPVWPPTGIALASLLLVGYRVTPGMFLGAFLANLTTYGTVWTSLGIATGNTLEGLAGAYLVNRYAAGANTFAHTSSIFRFIILAAITSTAVSATVGVTSLALGGFASWADVPVIWLTWWLGDATGALIFAPFLILLWKNFRFRWDRHAALERALFLSALLGVSWIVFGGLFPFAYLTVPLLVWAAFRFDQREAAAVIVFMTLIAVWATVRHLGPFVVATPNESLLMLQTFMGIMAVVALPLASMVAERRAVEQEAKDLLLSAHAQKTLLENEVHEDTRKVLEVERRRAAESIRSHTLIAALSNVAAHLVSGSTPGSMMQILGNGLKSLGMKCAVTSLDSQTGDLIVQYASVESRALALAEKMVGMRLEGFRVKRERFRNYADLIERRRSLFIPALSEIATEHIPHIPSHIAEQALRLVGIEPTTPAIFMPLIMGGSAVGTMGVWGCDVQEADIPALSVFAGHVAVSMEKARLFGMVQHAHADLTQAYDTTLEGWSRAMDLRDKETEGHTQRVSDLTVRLARELGVPEADLVHMRRGALLHDIGKMGVPDGILLKPGPLTDAEWAVMRKHPVYAHELLLPIEYLRPALDIPYCHHEKWDATGYPRGLKGERIPLAARIFAVVDVWDALTSDRPYRPAWTRAMALDYIRQEAGKSFDPKVVAAFIRLAAEFVSPVA
ncbi:MAG TPA: MASE1 domain-containing protein [bacterium]|nr:MASE1 domain-containing protein [bacterium]